MSFPISFTFDREAMDFGWVVNSIIAQDWGAMRSPHDVKHALSKSLICGAFDGSQQVGFIRAITDERFFAYIGDLIVDNDYRAQGVGTQLVAELIKHPCCSEVLNWMVTTRSAVPFFERLGFKQASSKTNLVAKGQAMALCLASDGR